MGLVFFPNFVISGYKYDFYIQNFAIYFKSLVIGGNTRVQNTPLSNSLSTGLNSLWLCEHNKYWLKMISYNKQYMSNLKMSLDFKEHYGVITR